MSALMSTDGIFKNMCSHGTKVEPNVIWQLIPAIYSSKVVISIGWKGGHNG